MSRSDRAERLKTFFHLFSGKMDAWEEASLNAAEKFVELKFEGFTAKGRFTPAPDLLQPPSVLMPPDWPRRAGGHQ